MDRRQFIAAAAASVAATAVARVAPSGVPCDVWSSVDGDCPRTAEFEYADPAINRAPRPAGPRNFCKDHLGCATSPTVHIASPQSTIP